MQFGDKAHEIILEGKNFKRIIKKAEGKAAGVDKWTARDLIDLPNEAYEGLAAIWNAILQGGKLPKIWTIVRVVTIPKPDGGSRGLSIANLIWRVGMTAIIEKTKSLV